MNSLTNFKAVYCSGIFIPEPSMVSALSLLFEKIYLPRNLTFIKEFAKKYEFTGKINTVEDLLLKDTFRDIFEEHNISPSISVAVGKNSALLSGLTDLQKETAKMYIWKGIGFALAYKNLFPEVFETLFISGDVSAKWDTEEERLDDNNKSTLTLTFKLELSNDEEDSFPNLISKGYIPVISSYPDNPSNQNIDEFSAKQIAALLAMKSIEIIFPKTRGVPPDIILEARERLSDHLPPFWSAMLKLSVEMKSRIKDCKSVKEVLLEAQFLVDTVVMPSLIDLQQKMLREEKDWFYKILSPVQKGLRIMIGNPPLTQQQLLTNALVLGSDVVMSAAENMRAIEALKKEAGLTFLLEAQKILAKDAA
jgi:hypothetical protein